MSDSSPVPTRIIRPDFRRLLWFIVIAIVVMQIAYIMLQTLDELYWAGTRNVKRHFGEWIDLLIGLSLALGPLALLSWLWNRRRYWYVSDSGLEIRQEQRTIEFLAWAEVQYVSAAEPGTRLRVYSPAGMRELYWVSLADARWVRDEWKRRRPNPCRVREA
jgi:hypothetical protein